jgi:hypothetical protein
LGKRDLVRLLVRAAEALPPGSAMSSADLRAFRHTMEFGGLSLPRDGLPPVTIDRPTLKPGRRAAFAETPEQFRQLGLL